MTKKVIEIYMQEENTRSIASSNYYKTKTMYCHQIIDVERLERKLNKNQNLKQIYTKTMLCSKRLCTRI